MSGPGKSGSVSSLTAAKVLFKTLIADRTTTPLSSATVNANSSTTTTTAETRGGAMRSSWRTRKRTNRPTNWPSSTNRNSVISEMTAASGWSQNPSRGTPIRSRTSSCHTWNQMIIRTIPTAPTTTSVSHAQRGAGGLESFERM